MNREKCKIETFLEELIMNKKSKEIMYIRNKKTTIEL